MSMTGLDTFDKTIQEANNWLKDLMYELNWEDRHKAYLGLRATLHALRDRLPPEEVAHLGAQLPMVIRGFYYEGWNPTGKPIKMKQKEEFFAHVVEELPGTEGIEVETMVRAVFKLLYHRISEGEIQDIVRMMPKELGDLWPRKV